ncbi:V-type proton ATPase subunit E2 [Linum perenne]
MRLKERSVLRCREADRVVVESVLEDAKREFVEKLKVSPPHVTLDKQVNLPLAPSSSNNLIHCWLSFLADRLLLNFFHRNSCRR